MTLATMVSSMFFSSFNSEFLPRLITLVTTSSTVSPCFTPSTLFTLLALTTALNTSLKAGKPSAPKRLQNLHTEGSETCARLANWAMFSFTTMAGSFKMTWASFLSDLVKSVSFSILSRMLELILNQLCY